MTLIKSISGIRGTIGGQAGENLTPKDVIEFVTAYSQLIKERSHNEKPKVVLGFDARPSGEMISQLTIQTLVSCGINVYNLGLSTTPTVEVNVTRFVADGGIILTASHNPKEWNALKFLNDKGEFLSKEAGQTILTYIEEGSFEYAEIDDIGSVRNIKDGIDYHVEQILDDSMIDADLIRSQKFEVVLDCINSTASLAADCLFEKLNCHYHLLNDDLSGQFAHNPEPLPEHVHDALEMVKKTSSDIGFVVDPDVDRLAIIDDNGHFIGEENTIICLANYLLPQSSNKTTVSNLSSSRGLKMVTEKHGGDYHASAVGEVNVVAKMKEVNAYFGGEGNGGVIFPKFHAGRDAILGMILFLDMLAKERRKLSDIVSELPHFEMVKSKIQLTPAIDIDKLLDQTIKAFENEEVDTTDGVKVNFKDGWVHLRKSNTEPIIRVYAEAETKAIANELINQVKGSLQF